MIWQNKKIELYWLTPTACLSDQSEKEHFWRKRRTNPTQRSHPTLHDVRLSEPCQTISREFLISLSGAVTHSQTQTRDGGEAAPPACFRAKLKEKGRLGGGWNRQTTQTNLLFLKVTNHIDKKPLFSSKEFGTVQYEIMGGSFIIDLWDSWGSWVLTVLWTHNGSIQDRHQHSESHNSRWIKVLNGCCILALVCFVNWVMPTGIHLMNKKKKIK